MSQWSRCQWFGWSDPGSCRPALLYLGFQPPTLLAFAERSATRALLCALRPCCPLAPGSPPPAASDSSSIGAAGRKPQGRSRG